jgi:hypothetical protein
MTVAPVAVPAHVIAWRELRNRWFADSALEEAVRSELVSEAKIPCQLGKYREFYWFFSLQ